MTTPLPAGEPGAPAPTEIRYDKAERRLTIRFADGQLYAYAAEFLRVHSPSAEVQGHSAAQRVLVPGKRLVGITAIEPVGNYAVQLIFDDTHDTGLYSWQLLRRLGEEQTALWARYRDELAAAGLSRD